MNKILKESSVRIKTGFFMILGVLLIGYIDSFFLVWLGFGISMLRAVSEMLMLLKLDENKIYLYVSIMWLVAYFYPKPEDLVFIVVIIFASILAYTKQINKQIFIPLLYPIASYLFLLSLYISYGMDVLLWLLMIVAGADIGAYFVGKSFGKTKFCETSPNKTLEGVGGGIVVSSILGIIFALSYLNPFIAFFISLIVAVASIFGDLFQSYLKRESGVKDSGDIFPGHGGMLDRQDGFLFAGVVLLVLIRVVS